MQPQVFNVRMTAHSGYTAWLTRFLVTQRDARKAVLLLVASNIAQIGGLGGGALFAAFAAAFLIKEIKAGS